MKSPKIKYALYCILVMAGLVNLLNFGYCFYNRSGIPQIFVIVFRDKWKMDAFTRDLNNVTSHAFTEFAGFAGLFGVKNPTEVVPNTILEMSLNLYAKAHHRIPNNDRACWNWQSIKDQTSQDLEELYFMVWDPFHGKILYQGKQSIRKGILLDANKQVR